MASEVQEDQEAEMTRKDAEMARIEQSWAEWRSPNTEVLATDGWRPVDDLATKPLEVDEILKRSYRKVDSE